MEKVTIRFTDGTEIEAEKNGSCFIVDEEPEIPADLSEVTITEGGEETVLTDVEFEESASVDGRFWFTFVVIPEETRKVKKMQANIEYIAMMTDVDLEEV